MDTVQTFQNTFSLSQSLDTASKLSNLYFIVKLTTKFGNFNLLFQKQNFLNCFLRKNEPFSQKERWLPNLRQQKLIARPWAGLTKQFYKSVPEMYFKMYKFVLKLTSVCNVIYKWIYKCCSVLISVLCLTVIVTVIFRQ